MTDTAAFDVIHCRSNRCSQKLRLPNDRGTLTVRCPTCKMQFDWTPPSRPKSAGHPAAEAFAKPPAAVAAATAEQRPFGVVQLPQGSRAWLQWRHDGIGGSDAPKIMGENPWRNAASLLREKVAPPRESFMNAAMKRGKELEPIALSRYAASTGREMVPICVQSTRVGWLRASLDGIARDGSAGVEIKCGERAYEAVAKNGEVPRYYYGQVQHILAITGLPALDFFCHWPGRSDILLRVPRNDDYIAHMLQQEQAFWRQVVRLRSA